MNELAYSLLGDLSSLINRSKDAYFEYLPKLNIISLIFSLILLYLIVYTIVKSGYFVVQAERWIEILGIKTVGRRRAIRGWRQILRRLRQKDQNQWKLAILEADKILDELIKFSGVKAETTESRLELLNPAQLSNLEEIKGIHRTALEIKRNPDYQLSHENARAMIKIYAQAFKEFSLID